MLKQLRFMVEGVEGCKSGWFVTVAYPVIRGSCVEVSSTLKLKSVLWQIPLLMCFRKQAIVTLFVSIWLLLAIIAANLGDKQ